MQEKEQTFYIFLPNGAKIVHRTSQSAVAYVGIMVGAGTRDEQPDENGIAHYIEHCVFKGCKTITQTRPVAEAQPVTETKLTKTMTARQIISQIEGIGGEINAYTTKEETTFYAATPVEHFAHTLRLIANMVLAPTFPKRETDKELSVIMDEIESYNDSPSELIYDDFESMIFSGHAMAMPILGTRKTLRHIAKSADIPTQWIQRHYTPDRMVFFSYGNISFQRVCRLVEQIMANHCTQPTYTFPKREAILPPPAEKQIVFRKHTHQTHVMLGGRAYPIGHPLQPAAYLMNNILGGGSLNSRLNLSLREKRGLVYTVESQYVPLSDTGYWSVYLASDSSDQDECIELVKKELERLKNEPLTPGQLKKAINQLHGQMAISAENKENNALAMAKLMLYHNNAPTWEETFREIEQITPAQIQAVAQELFDCENLYILRYN